MKKLTTNKHEGPIEDSTSSIPLLLRLQSPGDPAISEYIDKLRSRFGQYVLPIEEVRSILDEEMGDKTLTGILYEMREEECQ